MISIVLVKNCVLRDRIDFDLGGEGPNLTSLEEEGVIRPKDVKEIAKKINRLKKDEVYIFGAAGYQYISSSSIILKTLRKHLKNMQYNQERGCNPAFTAEEGNIDEIVEYCKEWVAFNDDVIMVADVHGDFFSEIPTRLAKEFNLKQETKEDAYLLPGSAIIIDFKNKKIELFWEAVRQER